MTSCTQAEGYQKRALESLSNLPPFSPTLNRLLAMLGNEDVSFSQLGTQIERDTVMAGNILKIVNSALYGREGTVTSIIHAISILGIARLRNCALSLSVNRLWSKAKTPGRWSSVRFNTHSLATAMMADRLAERIPVEYSEGAFAAGLFHDLGKLLIAMTSIADYDTLLKEFTAAEDMEQRELELLGVTHSQLSALALDRWNLPNPIQLAVLSHHTPSPRSLANIVNLANRTVTDLGLTLERPPNGFHPAESFPYLEEAGVKEVAPIIASFQEEFGMLNSIS